MNLAATQPITKKKENKKGLVNFSNQVSFQKHCKEGKLFHWHLQGIFGKIIKQVSCCFWIKLANNPALIERERKESRN